MEIELIQDGKEKKYDILLSKSYSRFGRNMVETLSAIKELREAGIRIILFGTTKTAGRKMKAMNAGGDLTIILSLIMRIPMN